MKFVFDLDGTLCTITDGDYLRAQPIQLRIEKVNKLYDRGNNIVIMTARGMGRSNGDINIAKSLFEELTKTQLKEWGVKFHQLILGKPAADYYIDDKGVNDVEFFK